MSDIDKLAQAWTLAKEEEAAAIAERREIEDKLVKQLRISAQSEGTENFEGEQFKVKVVSKLNRKIDSNKLQEIAAEHGMSEHLQSLFRWKAELNMSAWKDSNPVITEVLSNAITTTPARPSFSITVKEQ